jgi:sodium-dependent dicarboxylate transporter 2/3/5
MTNSYRASQKIGLFLGPLVALIVILIPGPEGLSSEAQRVGAIALLMSIWWITEAIPIYATALLPLALMPLLGVSSIKNAASSYAEPTIFLFMGGFFLAITMQRWNLHKRIALYTVRFFGSEPKRLLLGFMIATALMSMWVSNTATTMMIFPIGLALVSQFAVTAREPRSPDEYSSFAKVVMLGIAYAASIGGVGTLIGTPPNAIFAGQIEILFPELGGITFFKWMLIGIPFVVVFLPLAWMFLAYFVLKKPDIEGGSISLTKTIEGLEPINRGEIGVFFVFILTVLGWIFRQDLSLGFVTIPGWANLLGIGDWVGDATVAIVASILLFIIPVDLKKGEFLLNWDWALKIPWGILILFGGGFSLAFGFQETGLASWLGSGFAGFADIPLPIFILLLCLLVTLFGELASNTALAVMLIPILGATAVAADIHPYIFIIPATMAASSGFMLPVATPPNAIVFGSGVLSIRDMMRAGFVLDLVGAVIITLVLFLIVKPLFGI